MFVQGGTQRFGNLVGGFFNQNKNNEKNGKSPVSKVTDESRLTREQFKSMLETIDLGLRGLPATAQVPLARCLQTEWRVGLLSMCRTACWL